MPGTLSRHSGRWAIYFVAIIIGLSFLRIIVSIAWDDALDINRQAFQLHSVVLKESVNRNVNASHHAINGIAAFLLSGQELSERHFNTVIEELSRQHPYILSVVYARAVVDPVNGAAFPVLYLKHQNFDLSPVDVGYDLISDEEIGASVRLSIRTGAVITDAVQGAPGTTRNYWMIKPLTENELEDGSPSDETEISGILALLVGTELLLGSGAADADLTVTMFNDTSSLSGRQLLFEKKAARASGESWIVESLGEDSTIQFDGYSIKLTTGRNVRWEEVDKSSVYIALLVGIGGTLLLIALVRTKDLQTRELQERNVVIERKVVEQTRQLALARDQALTASRSKSEFLASMSHEIRTPLNAIIGMSELLVETPLSEEQKKYIEVFRKAGDTLLALVNDILDLSKIEARQVVLENIPFNLVETMESALDIYAHKASEKGVELLAVIDSDVPITRLGDPSRLRQIILNLVSNALKFTEQGEIVVSAGLEPSAREHDVLHFTVRDTGIGIPQAKLEAIFESFTQVDSSTTRKYGGTGLGLTICRSLTGMMGGEIWVESEEGKGSTFHFTANLKVTDKPEPESQQVILKDKSILIVDDNATNRLIINKQLSDQGARVVEAESADAALEKINDQSTPFDAVLVDCRMPGMDGFELIETFKSQGHNLSTVMMLGSGDLNEFTFRADELGISKYLVKPIKRNELLRHVSKLLTGIDVTEQAKEAAKEAEDTTKPLSILLVDDNADNRLLVQAYLKKLPYTIEEAEDGRQAVEKFQSGEFNVVLMDVQMPVMDGHEATRTIRDWERQTGRQATPIIALTAHAIKEEIDKCLAAGCDSHLSKPVKKATLIETLQSITH